MGQKLEERPGGKQGADFSCLILCPVPDRRFRWLLVTAAVCPGVLPPHARQFWGAQAPWSAAVRKEGDVDSGTQEGLCPGLAAVWGRVSLRPLICAAFLTYPAAALPLLTFCIRVTMGSFWVTSVSA